ncbi:DUF4440 domain-containing protein [Sphingomonas psychrotolerans]|uniref:DUF4440 domain-containing protein n=1 Tax=Sphingomonas psychrotolerans TaxID=1327635 RepID=UPI001F28CB89|nr:DUF4440 domain-containing protein [Sphingomonas psychrotolerans]
MRAALLGGDPVALASRYADDAISMPEYQPALPGRASVLAYWLAIAPRLRLTEYAPVTEEVIDLGGKILETGSFTLRWRAAGGEERSETGKFANLWVRGPGGLLLKADVRGFHRRLDDAASFHVALPDRPAPAPADTPLARELAALARASAEAVRTYDAEARIAQYAPDAIFMPFADTPKRGIAAIRAHLMPYVEGGRGVVFDEVRVWNVGHEDLGDHVIEYGKFYVASHQGAQHYQTSGGGLRLWKRGSDGKLRIYRQIATHDHRD